MCVSITVYRLDIYLLNGYILIISQTELLRKSKIFLCSRPVSAYALFFRDTQAAIKGQNPNASFGEVSKIVASMWDALDTEHKNVSFVCVNRSNL